MLPVSFDRQVLPGTFEYTLNYLIDEKIDLSIFEARYQNDENGAPAYDRHGGRKCWECRSNSQQILRFC
jgi:hypothetical protein